MEHDSLYACACELEVEAATLDRELGVVVRAVRSLQGRIAVGEDIAKTPKALAGEPLDKMFELWGFVEGLNVTVGCKRAPAAVILDTELVPVWSFTTAAFLESKGMLNVIICDVVTVSLSMLLLILQCCLLWGFYDQAWVLFVI